MKLSDLLPDRGLKAAANLFGVVRRRLWSTPGRTHLELPALDDREYEEYVAVLQRRLERTYGVDWAEPNGALNRMVVAWDVSRTCGEAIEEVADEVEARWDITGGAYDPALPPHPGDDEPVVRQFACLAACVTGTAAGVLTKLLRATPRPLNFDLAVASSIVDNVPRLHKMLADRLGETTADNLLGVISPIAHGLGSGPVGPAVEFLYQMVGFVEVVHRRRGWLERHSELDGSARKAAAERSRRIERPTAFPDGPIERYADDAWNISLGGFAVGLADTQQIERAVTPLLDALPKPGRYGRDAFAAQMTAALADRSMVVLDPDGLRRLDRIDRIVVDGALRADGNAFELLLTTLREQDLAVTVASDEPHRFDGPRVDDCRTFNEISGYIADCQADGEAVALFADGPRPGLQRADFAVGFTFGDDRIPWEADLLGGDDFDEVLFVAESFGAARRVSKHCVSLAGWGAAVGALLGIRGLQKTRPSQVMLAVNAASVIALGYGAVSARLFSKQVTTAPPPEIPWHEMEFEEVYDRVGSAPGGLSSDEAKQRQPPDVRPPSQPVRMGRAFGHELANPLTPVLAAGGAISAVVGSMTDAAIVGSVIGFNALLGGLQRFGAEESIERMARRDPVRVKTRRDDTWREVPADELVAGDVIRFEAGDVVPADCRIVAADDLEVDQSSLTGESLPVPKDPPPTGAEAIADRSSMLYDGTAVAAGTAEAVVVATGDDTKAGEVAPLRDRSEVAAGVEARLEQFSKMVLPYAGTSGGILMGLGVLRHRKLEELIGRATNLAVGAIPEGLPLLATTAQLAAARRLAERNVVVRNPRAMEAIGRADVVCLDKTGTLTVGELQFAGVFDGESMAQEHFGASHRRVMCAGLRATPVASRDDPLPHATDRAISEGITARGFDRGNWQVIDEVPFQTGRGFHAVFGRLNGRRKLAVKGSPEAVLERCTGRRKNGGWSRLGSRQRRELLDCAERMAAGGLRVLAVAERRFRSDTQELTADDIDGLTFEGFLALTDPVRPSAKPAVDALTKAGVELLMLTGDHPETARRIAGDVGLPNRHVLTGPELEQLDDSDLADALSEADVIARMTPGHKVRIVDAFQNAGRAVAMTGDGANDAAAIRLADVGIALGEDAASAARSAADLVVTDGRVETLVDAVVEGRAMWRSVRDAVSILIGGNLGEIGFMLASGVVEPLPALNARQLLLVNLFTDVAPSIAIALQPPPDIPPERLVEEGPEQSLGKPLERDIAWRGGVTAASGFFGWFAARHTFQKKRADTVGLLSIVTSQLAQTLTVSKPTAPVWAASLGSTAALLALIEIPGISHLLGCRPLGPAGLTTAFSSAAIATGASLVIPRIPEWRRRLRKRLPVRPEPSPPEFFDDFYAASNTRGLHPRVS